MKSFLTCIPPLKEKLIYVNYGRVEDYAVLQNITPEVNISDSVVIVRYGKIFRGDKVTVYIHGTTKNGSNVIQSYKYCNIHVFHFISHPLPLYLAHLSQRLK